MSAARVRSLASLLPALAVALGLFWLMQWLVSGDAQPPPTAQTPLELERLALVAPPLPPPTVAEPRNRPAPPAAGAGRGSRLAPSPAPAPAQALQIAIPAIGLPAGLSGAGEPGHGAAGFSIGAREDLEIADSAAGYVLEGREAIPIASVRPRYPRYAAERGLEGWVELLYTIRADGRVTGVRIIDASPRGIFEEAAAAAVSQWLYAPLYKGGKPLLRQATQRFEWRREDIDALHLRED